jgi:hypothetical protein
MVDMFNQPTKNTRNRAAAEKIAEEHNKSVNEQIVSNNTLRDIAEAKQRVLLPDLSGVAEQRIDEQNATVKDQRRYVASIAAKIGTDASFKATMHHSFVSKQEVDYAPIAYMAHIQRLLSPTQLLSLPMGGTTEEDVKGSNERFDKFPITYFDKVEQKKRSKQTSVYRELVEQTDEGHEWTTRMENLRRAKNKQAEAPQDMKGKRPVWYEQELQTCSQALSDHTKWMRQGCSLAKQLASFSPVMNAQNERVYPLNVSARLATYKDDEGKVFYSKYKKPVILEAQPIDPEKNDFVSIASFNSINLKDVTDWDSLVKAMERGVPEEEGGDDEDKVNGVVDFQTAITPIHSWIDSDPRAAYTSILHVISKKGSDDLILSLGAIGDLIEQLSPHMRERLVLLRKKEANEKEAAAFAAEQADASKSKEQQAAESAALVQAAANLNT